jgi:hypothetical protein
MLPHGPDTFFLCRRKLDETDFHTVLVHVLVAGEGATVAVAGSNK